MSRFDSCFLFLKFLNNSQQPVELFLVQTAHERQYRPDVRYSRDSNGLMQDSDG
jgi:hypothetical protein